MKTRNNCGKGIFSETTGKALQWPRFSLAEVRVSWGGGCFLHGQGFPRQVAVHAMGSFSRSDSASLQEFLVPLPDLLSVTPRPRLRFFPSFIFLHLTEWQIPRA